MSNAITLQEKRVELAKVTAARMDLELTVLKKYDEIERLKKNISIQNVRIDELTDLICSLEATPIGEN